MSRVCFEGVVKKYGDVVALRRLDLEIREGEFLTLLGPSGCGKTTTLRLIAGFILPTAGTIRLGDDDVTRLAPQDREIGMVFQDYALFPHMTVSENIAFGLVERGTGKKQARARVEELLELVKLPDAGERFPSELSGGQRQRVAVARAVAHPPRVLLMDEPLGALDLKLREVMQVELRRIQQRLGITTVYVTHDQGEAMNMSDRVAVMSNGAIEQLDTARDLYLQPRTRFVADFIGQINFLETTVVSDSGQWLILDAAPGGTIRAPREIDARPGDRLTVGIRPESLNLHAPDARIGDADHLQGTIADTRFGGNSVKVVVAIGDACELIVEERPNAPIGAVGEKVLVSWNPGDTVVLRD